MQAFLLAAGIGARLQPLTDKIPKPLVKVFGKPLIVHHIEKLVKAGITNLVINVFYLKQQIIDYLGDGSAFGVNISYSIEDELLDTGGGILNALPLLGDNPFVLLSSDIYSDYNYKKLLDFELRDNLAHLVMVPNPSFKLDGDFGIITRTKLLSLNSVPKYTFGNISIISPLLFKECLNRGNKIFPLAELFKKYIIQEKISGELFVGGWHNIGTIEELNKLEKIGEIIQ